MLPSHTSQEDLLAFLEAKRKSLPESLIDSVWEELRLRCHMTKHSEHKVALTLTLI